MVNYFVIPLIRLSNLLHVVTSMPLQVLFAPPLVVAFVIVLFSATARDGSFVGIAVADDAATPVTSTL